MGAPLFGRIPPVATAPVLMLVGAMMAGEARGIDWDEIDQVRPSPLHMIFSLASLRPIPVLYSCWGARPGARTWGENEELFYCHRTAPETAH